MRRRAWPGLLVLALVIARPAWADDREDEARRAYDRGAAAFERGDFKLAAASFADADATLPNTTTLRAAIDAASEGDDAVLAETLIERAATRPTDAALEKAVRDARARFAGKTGRIRIECPTTCIALIDGAVARASQPIVVLVGTHEVKVDTEGEVRAVSVRVEPDRSHTVQLARRAPTGLSPVWVSTAGALTVGAGVLAAILLADTISKHDQFLAAGCLHDPTCAGAAADGHAAQTRSNVMIGATLGLAVITITLAAFTRWRTPPLALTISDRAFDARLTF